LKHLAGKQFASDADRKQAFTTHCRHSDTDLKYAGIQALVLPQVGIDGDYVCGGLMCTTCNPYATYTLKSE